MHEHHAWELQPLHESLQYETKGGEVTYNKFHVLTFHVLYQTKHCSVPMEIHETPQTSDLQMSLSRGSGVLVLGVLQDAHSKQSELFMRALQGARKKPLQRVDRSAP